MADASVWYNKTWLVLLLLLVFFPVGLFALYKNEQLGKPIKLVLAGLVAIVFIISQLPESAEQRERRLAEASEQAREDSMNALANGAARGIADSLKGKQMGRIRMMVEEGQKAGLIRKMEAQFGRVYVDASLWQALNVEQKEQFARAIGYYLSDGEGERVRVIDHQSGRELAEVGVMGGFNVK